MPTFSPIYSDEQRAGVVAAILDGVEGLEGSGPGGRLTARQAVEAAAEGRLPGLSPFEFKVSTARHYAQLARRERREAQAAAEEAAADDPMPGLIARMRRIAVAELERLEKDKTARRPVDMGLLREVARTLKEINALSKQHEASNGTQGATGDASERDSEPAGLVARLAAQQDAGDAPSEETPKGQHEETEAVPGAETPAEKADGQKSSEGEKGFRVGVSESGAQRAAAQALLEEGVGSAV